VVAPSVGSPDLVPVLHGVCVGQTGVSVEVRTRVLKDGLPQRLEPGHIPGLDVGLGRINVDGKIEVVRDEDTCGSPRQPITGLQHVETFDNHDVRPIDHLELARHDVVRLV